MNKYNKKNLASLLQDLEKFNTEQLKQCGHQIQDFEYIRIPFEKLLQNELRARIYILGPISVGKTTLINALIGRTIFPSHQMETTNTINIIRHNQYQEQFKLYTAEEKKIFVQKDRFITEFIKQKNVATGVKNIYEYFSQINQDVQNVKNQFTSRFFIIEGNIKKLQKHDEKLLKMIEFIDLPGIDSQNMEKENKVLELVNDSINLLPCIPLFLYDPHLLNLKGQLDKLNGIINVFKDIVNVQKHNKKGKFNKQISNQQIEETLSQKICIAINKKDQIEHINDNPYFQSDQFQSMSAKQQNICYEKERQSNYFDKLFKQNSHHSLLNQVIKLSSHTLEAIEELRYQITTQQKMHLDQNQQQELLDHDIKILLKNEEFLKNIKLWIGDKQSRFYKFDARNIFKNTEKIQQEFENNYNYTEFDNFFSSILDNIGLILGQYFEQSHQQLLFRIALNDPKMLKATFVREYVYQQGDKKDLSGFIELLTAAKQKKEKLDKEIEHVQKIQRNYQSSVKNILKQFEDNLNSQTQLKYFQQQLYLDYQDTMKKLDMEIEDYTQISKEIQNSILKSLADLAEEYEMKMQYFSESLLLFLQQRKHNQMGRYLIKPEKEIQDAMHRSKIISIFQNAFNLYKNWQYMNLNDLAFLENIYNYFQVDDKVFENKLKTKKIIEEVKTNFLELEPQKQNYLQNLIDIQKDFQEIITALDEAKIEIGKNFKKFV